MQNTNDFNKIFSNPSYSKNSKSQTSSLLQITDAKKRYVTVIQQQKDNQRRQLHKKLQKKKEEDEKMYRKHLKAEIKKRRKELEQLQHLKETGAEEYKKAAHQAEIKKEKDNIKKLEESIKIKLANEKSNKRFKQAVQKQKFIDDEINKKKIQAKYMRNTHLKSEVAQRQTAVKFSKSLHQRQTKEQQQKAKMQTQNFELFKKGINVHGLSHRVLNSSRPVTFVVKQNQQDDAINEARKQQLRNSQKQKLRDEVLQKNRKTAEQRGNAVLQRMQRQKEYERYCRQADQQQKRYNLRRLQAGKRNQYAGVKPLTLSQIDVNKKNRSQRQFQKMFLDKTQTPFHGNEPANKYKIIETKMIYVTPQIKKTQKWMKKPINYGENESLIPGVSQGHYQFEQGAEVQFQKQTGFQMSKKQQGRPHKKNIEFVKRQQISKNRLKETKMTNQAFKQQLDYSDSEQDSNI